MVKRVKTIEKNLVLVKNESKRQKRLMRKDKWGERKISLVDGKIEEKLQTGVRFKNRNGINTPSRI